MGNWLSLLGSAVTTLRILLLMTVSRSILGEELGNSSTESEYQHGEMVSSSLVHKFCPRGCTDPLNNSSLSFSALCHLVCFTFVETFGGTNRNGLGKQYDNRQQGIFRSSDYNSDFPSAFKSSTRPQNNGEQVAKTQSDSKFYFDEYSREKVSGLAESDLGNSGIDTNALESSSEVKFFSNLTAPLTGASHSNITVRHISKIKDVLSCGFHINPNEHPQGAHGIGVLRNSYSETIQPVKNRGINPIKVEDNFSSENITGTLTSRLHARADVLPLPSLTKQFGFINKIQIAVGSNLYVAGKDNYTLATNSPTSGFKISNWTIPSESLNFKIRGQTEFLKHPGKIASGMLSGHAYNDVAYGQSKHFDVLLNTGDSLGNNTEDIDDIKYKPAYSTVSKAKMTELDLRSTSENKRKSVDNNSSFTAQGFNIHKFLHNILNAKNVSHFGFLNHPRKHDLSIQRNAVKLRWDPFHISSTMSNNTVNTVDSPYPLKNDSIYYSVQVLPMQKNSHADVLKEKVNFSNKSERPELHNPEKYTQDGTEKTHHSPATFTSFEKKHDSVNTRCPEFVDYSLNESCETVISRTHLPYAFITLPPNHSEFQEASELLYGRVLPLSLFHSSFLPSNSPSSLFSSMSSSLSQASSRASATIPLGSLQLPQTSEFLTRKPFSEKVLMRSRRTVIISDTPSQPGSTKVRKPLQSSSMPPKSTSTLSNAIKPTRQQNINLVQTQNTAVLHFLSGLGPLKLESENIGRKNAVDQLPCHPVSNCIRKYGDHPLDFCIYGFLPACQEGYVRCLDNYFGPFNELCLNELSSLKGGPSSQT